LHFWDAGTGFGLVWQKVLSVVEMSPAALVGEAAATAAAGQSIGPVDRTAMSPEIGFGHAVRSIHERVHPEHAGRVRQGVSSALHLLHGLSVELRQALHLFEGAVLLLKKASIGSHYTL